MLEFIKSLFTVKERSQLLEKDPMKKFLIVGLGNIGADYEGTRHNIGFQILNALSKNAAIPFEPAKLGAIAKLKLKGKSVLLLQPSTYMNRSGKAVRYWMEKENIPLEHLLIITDDLNLVFGTLRLKSKGSDGGHNGLKDIQHVLETTKYHRFRFGVGSNFSKGKQIDYVLGKWNEDEIAVMQERIEKAEALINSFVLAGPQITMNTFNGT